MIGIFPLLLINLNNALFSNEKDVAENPTCL
jgi:hypothetical protein